MFPLPCHLFKETPIIKLSDIFLLHAPIFGPEKEVGCEPYVNISHIVSPSRRVVIQTFNRNGCPAKRICQQSLTLEHIEYIPYGDIVLIVRVLGEHVFKLLRHKATFIVVCSTITSMLTLVNVFEIDAEKGIGEESADGRVGKSEVNNDYGDDAEEEIKS